MPAGEPEDRLRRPEPSKLAGAPGQALVDANEDSSAGV